MVRPVGSGSGKNAHIAAWQVKRARIEDAALVHRVMREAYREYDGAIDPPMSASAETEGQVTDAMRRGGAVLAWDGATPVGSARYRLSSEFVHIKRVSVLPSWRGRGIASAMLGYIERLALDEGRTQARLQVRMSLARNLALYQRVGYRVSELKAHPRGQDVVGTLVKQLGDGGVTVQAFRLLRGPNLHWHKPVLEAVVAVAEQCLPGEGTSAFVADLNTRLPGLDIAARPEGDRVVADAVGRIALELQRRVEFPVSLARTEPVDAPGSYRIIVDYHQEETARPAFDTALELVRAALTHAPLDIERALEQLMERADYYRLGPSAAAIVAAAQERGIPALRPRPHGHFVQLGWGVHRKHVEVSETSATSAIAVRLCKKKPRTNALLRTLGVPVPAGRTVHSADEAWQAAVEIGLPVVTKPEAGNEGKGVSAGLETEEQVRSGYDVAEACVRRERFRGAVMVEREIEGNQYRLVVVNGSLVAASQFHPAQVVGDGQRTVRELVEIVNSEPRRRPRRGEWFPIVLDDAASLALAQQNLTFDSIPESGQAVKVRQNANLSTGGTPIDVTERVHPFNARMAELAACAVGLDVAGVDLMCHDIARPTTEQGGAIIEVNAQPGFQGALFPAEGQPRQVGKPIVEMLFPPGTRSRIPLIAILRRGKAEGLGRTVARVCEAAGQVVGLNTPEGISVSGQRLEACDSSQQAGMRTLLLHPLLESLVVEMTPETVREEGLPFDRCDIAILMSRESSKGDATSDWQKTALVLARAVDRAGTLVVDAAEREPTDDIRGGPALMYTSAGRDDGALDRHQARGGRCVLVRDGHIVLTEGEREIAILQITERKPAGGMAGTLSAVAAGWAAGFPAPVIAQALTPDGTDVWTSTSPRPRA
jgi:cyanophycin synthetase